jgi:tRNA(Ile)-lysidine synthase
VSSGRASHPPTLLRLAERELRDQKLVDRGQLVLLAVSGGPDSMALGHVMASLRKRFGYELAACGVDHGIRPAAVEELHLAASGMAALGVAFEAVHLQVPEGPNLMARARDARFAALRKVASRLGAASIALGHHADDRAETVLIRLLQGAGPAGLAVLASRSGDLIRPLIRAHRSDILGHLARHAVPYANDPTNEDRRYLRAAVRGELIPALKALSPRIVEHLCHLADDLGALELGRPEPLLKRAHLQALGLAAGGRGSVRIALPGGRVARFDPESSCVVVEPGPGRDVGGTARRRRAEK